MAGPMMLPQYQGTLYDLQRKQQLAQMLTQSSLQPLQATPVGGMGARISPLQVIAQGLGAYLGNRMGSDVSQGLNSVGQQQYGAMVNMFGGGQAPAQSSPSSAMAVPADAAPDTADGFTPPAPAQSNEAATGAPQSSGNGGMTLYGKTPQQTAMAYMLSPDETIKQLIAQGAPTDTVKNLIAQGLTPGSPEFNAALGKINTKAGYLEPLMGRPGTIARDPVSGKPLFFNPAVPPGGTPLFDASGNVVAMQPIPGAAAVAQQMSGAEAAGKAQYQVLNGYDAQGNPAYTTALAAAGGGQAPGGQNAQGGSLFPGYQAPGGQVRPALPPGQEEGARVQGKANGERGVGIINDLANAKNDLYNYRDMAQLVTQFKPGQGADTIYKLNGYLNNILPPGLQIKDQNELASYQTFSKLAIQTAAQQQKALGGVADNTLQTLLHANPNPNMQGQTIQNVTSYLQGLSLARMGKATAYQQWLDNGNSPANENKFEAAWNQAYDPRVYMLASMSPPQRQAFLATQPKATVQQLQQKARVAAQNGFLQQDWLQ